MHYRLCPSGSSFDLANAPTTSMTVPKDHVDDLRIAAGVLHYRYWPDVRETIDGLMAQTRTPDQVVIIDHASGDGSAEQLRRAYPDLEIIEMPDNRGPAGGMSQLVEDLLARDVDAVFPLPDDLVLAPDALEQLELRLLQAPQVGAVGPLVAHRRAPDRVFCAGCRLDTRTWELEFVATPPDLSDWQGKPPQESDFLGTGGILLRAELGRRLAPMPAQFFHGFDDVDYTLRLAALGRRLECVPAAVAWQDLGDRTQDELLPPANPYLLVRNKLGLIARNGSRWMVVREILRTAKWVLRDAVSPRNGSRADLRPRFLGLVDFCRGRWGPPPTAS